MPTESALTTAAVILAGGRGTRMGAGTPKPLTLLAGRPLIGWVLASLPAGIAPILVNAPAGSPYAVFGHPVVPDLRDGHAGPLAGLEAAATWLAEAAPATTHLLGLPADTPFLTRDVVVELLRSAGPRARAARHAGRLHPTATLWPLTGLARRAGARLDGIGKTSLMALLNDVGFEPVDVAGDDPFFNVNTPEDLEEAARRMSDG